MSAATEGERGDGERGMKFHIQQVTGAARIQSAKSIRGAIDDTNKANSMLRDRARDRKV